MGIAVAQPKDDAVHNRLRQVRIERGISRRNFADAVGIHYQTVGYLERGEYSPSLPMALKIVAYFELPLESVFSSVPSPRWVKGAKREVLRSARAGGEAGTVLPDRHLGGDLAGGGLFGAEPHDVARVLARLTLAVDRDDVARGNSVLPLIVKGAKALRLRRGQRC